MKLSQFLLKTTKESPSEAPLPSQRLMLRSGMIRKAGAPGLFAWMPLGARVLAKIEKLIHKEMELAGAQRVDFPIIQSAEAWYKTGRLQVGDNSYGPEMLRMHDRNGTELLVSPTAEELFTSTIADMNLGQRDLPLNLYQVEKKFRDEVRPRFGTLRSREFTMKDGYSFDATAEDSLTSYHKMFAAYQRIFHKMGVLALPLEAPRGPVGGSLSHEFVIPATYGESDILFDPAMADVALIPSEKIYNNPLALATHFNKVSGLKGLTEEMLEKGQMVPAGFTKTRGIEVGHIFNLGTRYSEPLQATYKDKEGHVQPMHMGCYGIGVSRLPAALIEASHDADGIIWSPAIAPFEVAVVNTTPKDEAACRMAENIYNDLKDAGFDAAYDDRNVSTGHKFADMDLIGIPVQIRVGKRDVQTQTVEIKDRRTNERTTVPVTGYTEVVRQHLKM